MPTWVLSTSYGVLTSIIDWSDASISDPALYFARLYRDFGPAFLTTTLDTYDGVDDPKAAMAATRFFARCAALEHVAYGLDSGRQECTRTATRALTWLFQRSS